MRLWAGYSEIREAGTDKKLEADFFKCCHCGAYETVKPFQTDFTRCWNCNDLLCKTCAGSDCVHFKKAIEVSESRDRLRRLIDQNGDYT